MKTKIQSDYFTPGYDIKTGDYLKFVDEAALAPSQFGMKMMVTAQVNVIVKKLRLNTISHNNMVKAYGDETKDWIGREALVEIRNTKMGASIVLLAPNTTASGEVILP